VRSCVEEQLEKLEEGVLEGISKTERVILPILLTKVLENLQPGPPTKYNR